MSKDNREYVIFETEDETGNINLFTYEEACAKAEKIAGTRVCRVVVCRVDEVCSYAQESQPVVMKTLSKGP